MLPSSSDSNPPRAFSRSRQPFPSAEPETTDHEKPATEQVRANSAFWITDFNFTHTVYVSRGFEKVFGRECASFYADPRSLFAAVHPNDRDRVIEHYGRQKQGVSLDQEYRITLPDGSIRWIWDRRSPMGDPSEQVYAGTAQDITDRKHAEQLLQRHSSVVQSSGEAILSTTLEGVITAWNPAATELFGYSAKEAIGASIMLIAPADAAEQEVQLLERIRRGEDVGTIETQRCHRNGMRIDVAVTITPLREPGAKISGAAVICRDITRAKAAEAALRESEQCFREAFDATPIGLVHASLDGQLVRVNRALCLLTGHTISGLLKQPLFDLFDPEDRAIDAVQFGDLLTGKSNSYSVEKRLQRRNDFPIWAKITVTAADRKCGAPSFLVVAIEDLTAKRDLIAQLRQAQKMETIGQLASGIAHDFNNVLGYVTMRSELTCTYPDMPTSAIADLQQIKAAANRATHLTRQLLAFSRNESATRPQRLDINELIGATTKMVQRLLGEDLTLDLHLHPESIVVHLDPGIVDQVLLNLAVNARDAMPEGGTLTIATSEYWVEDSASRPSPEIVPGRYVCLRVTDTGSGIAPENLPHIFEPFFTTKQPGRGTGLGLTMVSNLVHQQRGWVDVDSQLGCGTTFSVYLPAADTNEIDHRTQATDSTRQGSETILLVEDQADLRITARMVLELKGYRVLEASTGVEALDMWAKHQTEISVIFTDMVLPDGISGRTLASRAQSERPDVRILFTTGYSPEVAGREVPLEEGQNFLPKPYSLERLLRLVEQSLTA